MTTPNTLAKFVFIAAITGGLWLSAAHDSTEGSAECAMMCEESHVHVPVLLCPYVQPDAPMPPNWRTFPRRYSPIDGPQIDNTAYIVMTRYALQRNRSKCDR